MNIIKYSKPIFWAFFICGFFSFHSCNGQSNETTREKIQEEKKSKVDSLLKNDRIEIINPTFLGNEKRNYYGNIAPNRLDLIWNISLGTGKLRLVPKPKPGRVQDGLVSP